MLSSFFVVLMHSTLWSTASLNNALAFALWINPKNQANPKDVIHRKPKRLRPALDMERKKAGPEDPA